MTDRRREAVAYTGSASNDATLPALLAGATAGFAAGTASRTPPLGQEVAELDQVVAGALAALLRVKPAGDGLRAWVVGCGSGEAVYTLAAGLREHLPHFAGRLQIFATDIDAGSLAAARAGRYPADLAAELSPQRLERCFIRVGGTYVVRPDLRELCVFSPHDLLRDPPFSRLDLIAARCPLASLSPGQRRDALRSLHFGLNPGGLLWLGPGGAAMPDPGPTLAAAGAERLYRRQEPLRGQPLLTAPGRQPSPGDAAALGWRPPPALVRWRKAGAATAGHSAAAALASAHGELQTSREELRVLGEKFERVDIRLTQRRSDLARETSGLHNALESTRIAIVFLDNELRVQSFTAAAAAVIELDGTAIGRPLAGRALRIGYPDLLADARGVLRSLGTIEREVSEAAGGRRYLARVLPYRRVDTVIGGVVLTFLDVTAAFQAKRESDERFRMMAHVVPAFLFVTDARGGWQYVNPRFYAFTGLSAEAALREGWWAAVHEDDRAGSRQAWLDALQGRAGLAMECRLIPAGGGEAWFLVRAAPQFDSKGRTVAWFGSCTDIDAARRGARMQRLLLDELHHRVTNILSAVRSVVFRSVQSSRSVDELAAHLSGRISAIARIQGVLARSGGEAADLSELVYEELAGHGGQMDRQTDVAGPPVVLGAKVAESLGLALHELTTNAIKYGALSVPSGRVSVRWQLSPAALAGLPQQRLLLEWRESGVPVTDLKPGRSGFGREVLEAGLPSDLGAQTSLEFMPGGIRCLIDLLFTPAQQF